MLDASLAELAHAHGVATEFGDWRGGGAAASTDAVTAVLTAMGVDASSPDAIRQSLDDVRLASWLLEGVGPRAARRPRLRRIGA
jgi:4-alpha-glucanotransferase